MGRRALVAANWKMNGRQTQIASLSQALLAGLAGISSLDLVICPPAVYLGQVRDALKGSALQLGAQNVHQEAKGAFTGEIAAPMLQDFDCRYAIVGHSERRQYFGETDAIVAAKFRAAQQSNLRPILCVGESAEQRDNGSTEAVVTQQVEAVLQETGVTAFAEAVIAYEPVWAIGTGRAATAEIAQAVHALIRNVVAQQDARVAQDLRIIYGGSVTAANAGELSAAPDIDGALVGGASLVAEDFSAICTSFAGAKA
ncbi:MAG: triose-phosphate isomerase [Pseudomonadota bacterium]|nr:triose-phosphate isomerase [Pseudomonadota bacterium]